MVVKILKKLDAIFDRIIGISYCLAGVVVVYQMVSTAGNTMSAYVANFTITGVESFSEFGMLWLVFLSAAWLLRNERHVTMDLVVSKLSPKNQSRLIVFTSLVCVIVCLIFVWYGVKVTWDFWERGIYDSFKLEGFPQAITLVIIPIGSFLLAVQFIRRVHRVLRVGLISQPAKIEFDDEAL